MQTLLALSTISPTLNEQFQALVNLAVVTNVIPYIMALSSADDVIMQSARVPKTKEVHRFNLAIATVAMLYSLFAIYASGKDAVLGGMLVTGLGFITSGIPRATRFTSGASPPRTKHERAELRTCIRECSVQTVILLGSRASPLPSAPLCPIGVTAALERHVGPDSR